MIYLRLLSLLPEDWSVHHYFSTWRSDSAINLKTQYQEQLGITPHFASFKGFRDLYGRVSRRWNQNVPDLRFPGLLDARQIRQVIRKIQPDVVWWSGDYLPISLVTLSAIPDSVFRDRRLLFSLYDPPGFWNSGKWKFDKLLKEALTRFNGIDVIGENMAELVKSLGYHGETIVLNDYADEILTLKSPIEGKFRVVVAGQIYGSEPLQELIDLLCSKIPNVPVEVHWYGNEANLKVTKKVDWRKITFVAEGTLPRDQMPRAIQDYDAGYLNFTQSKLEFSKYSVPTKLITYLEAGLPVIFHADQSSEIHLLNSRYEFGLNLKVDDDLQKLQTHKSKYQKNAQLLIERRYQKSVIQERLIHHLLANEK